MNPQSPRQEKHLTSQRRRAFTLLELLSAMAIIVVLMALARNIVGIDSRRTDVNAAVDDFSGILQVARLEARSKATFVWVCLQPVTSSVDGGMRVALFASRDGSSDSSSGNLYPLGGRPLLKRVALKDTATTTPIRLRTDYETSSIDPENAKRMGGSTLTITYDAQSSFSDLIVGFNPRGEAFIPGQGASGFIEFLFSPLQDKNDLETKSSTILLSRSTGSTQVYR